MIVETHPMGRFFWITFMTLTYDGQGQANRRDRTTVRWIPPCSPERVHVLSLQDTT